MQKHCLVEYFERFETDVSQKIHQANGVNNFWVILTAHLLKLIHVQDELIL